MLKNVVILGAYNKDKIVYAMAKTKDGENAFFYLTVKEKNDIDDWLSRIYHFANKNYFNKINQKDFEAQFTKIELMGNITEYIHKLDNSIKFRITN